MVVEVIGGAIVKFKVARLSQPTLLVKVAVLEPAALKVIPFQV